MNRALQCIVHLRSRVSSLCSPSSSPFSARRRTRELPNTASRGRQERVTVPSEQLFHIWNRHRLYKEMRLASAARMLTRVLLSTQDVRGSNPLASAPPAARSGHPSPSCVTGRTMAAGIGAASGREARCKSEHEGLSVGWTTRRGDPVGEARSSRVPANCRNGSSG